MALWSIGPRVNCLPHAKESSRSWDVVGYPEKAESGWHESNWLPWNTRVLMSLYNQIGIIFYIKGWPLTYFQPIISYFQLRLHFILSLRSLESRYKPILNPLFLELSMPSQSASIPHSISAKMDGINTLPMTNGNPQAAEKSGPDDKPRDVGKLVPFPEANISISAVGYEILMTSSSSRCLNLS